MTNEIRRELFSVCKHFILNNYSPNLMPTFLTQNITKYANIPNKGQMLLSTARSHYYRYVGDNLKQRLFFFLTSKNCHSIAAQRVRRTIQISDLYRSLGYDLAAFQAFYQNVLNCLFSRLKLNPSLLLGAVAFSWVEGHISDDELDSTSAEINFLQKLEKEEGAGWEKVVVKEQVQVLRQPICDSSHFQYKVLGSYKDVSARSFFNIQIDLEYRKKWDKNVISLDKIDQDDRSGSEVVHWVTHFPYPLTSREYIYVRRYKTDNKARMMMIVNRGLDDHPSIQTDNKHVRVTEYCSKMVIRPHTSFDEDGFDFVLTYYDDPKSNLPRMAQSWAASSGIPDFVDKLHKAAVMLQQEKVVNKKLSYEPHDNILLNNASNNNILSTTNNDDDANTLSNDSDKEKDRSISKDIKLLSADKENISPSLNDQLTTNYFNNNNNNNKNNNNNNNSNKHQSSKNKGNLSRHNYTDPSSLPL